MRAFIRSNQRICYEPCSRPPPLRSRRSPQTNGSQAATSRLLRRASYLGQAACLSPHIHYIVPGGAFSSDYSWHASRLKLFVGPSLGPVQSQVQDEMKKAGLYTSISSKAWEPAWNVNNQPVGKDGKRNPLPRPLRVQGRHIRQQDRSVQNGLVSFHCRKHGSNRLRTMTLSAHGIHSPLPPARPAHRIHEGALLRIHACKLPRLHARRHSRRRDRFRLFTDLPPYPWNSVYPVCPLCGGELVYQYSILAFQKRSAMNSS